EKRSIELKIHLENDQLIMYGSSTESAGCILRGVLSLELDRPTKLQSLALHFYGTMTVSWSRLLGGGNERKHKNQQVLINHTWMFLPATQQNNNDESINNGLVLLEAGNYTYEFELVLPGSLPESAYVAKYFIVQYQLKAVAERSSFLLPNYTTWKEVHISRQKLLSSLLTTDYFDPILISHQCGNELNYAISIPTKVYSPGDTIPISVHFIPFTSHLRIKYICCTFKEYMTCHAIHGRFNGKNKLHGRVIHYLREDYYGQQNDTHERYLEGLWTSVIDIKVPSSLTEIQCDIDNDSVKVRHKLKFIVSIENKDRNISELRTILPVVIAIDNSVKALPAYGEIWNTLPYDPALMMALLRHTSETSANSIIRDIGTIRHQFPISMANNYEHNIPSLLPSYNSILSA
ncbi:uncharacterized protein BX663DRAFT_517778, partial [Cokeromyces recurvatus]|uniref:uncharacterized protein n=1 Tax=Cokeromyces recurvatus TaxID=90255 RepID=UPI00221FE9AE